MKYLIKLEQRLDGFWYTLWHEFEGEQVCVCADPQFGGWTERKAINSAKRRFGTAYELEQKKVLKLSGKMITIDVNRQTGECEL